MSNATTSADSLASEFAQELAAPPAAPAGITVVNTETEEVEVQQQRSRGRQSATAKTATPAQPTKPFVQQSHWRGFLDRIMPTAESLKVYKRMEGGKLTFINNYSVQDVQSCPDMEVFLQRHLMPVHGAGDYEVALTNSKGETSRVLSFSVMDPNGVKEKTTPDKTTEKVIDKLFAQQEELRKQLAEKPKEPSMGDKLTEMKALMDMFGGGDTKKSNDPMMMIMMMKLLGDDKPKGPDPAIMAALEGIKTVAASVAELSKEVREIKNAPPPPMPLPVDPGPSLMDTVKTLAEVMRPPAPPTQPPLSPIDMLRTVKDLMPQPQSMQPKDMLSLAMAALPMFEKLFGKNEINDLKQQLAQVANGGSRGLREVLQDMQMLQQVMGGGESDSDSFWAVAGKLVDNIGEVAAVVEALKGDEDDQPEQKNKKKSATVSERREVIKTKAKKVVQKVVDERVSKSDMPPGFDKRVAKIEEADDDAHRIDATLKAFFFLARKRPDPFQKYLENFFALAKIADGGGDDSAQAKEKIVELVGMFLNAVKARKEMQEHGILQDEECIKKVVAAFKNEIDKLVKYLTKPPVTAGDAGASKEG